jgi:hypothetical protein
MCPACIGTTVLLVASVSSASGLAALAVNFVRSRHRSEAIKSPNPKEMYHAE